MQTCMKLECAANGHLSHKRLCMPVCSDCGPVEHAVASPLQTASALRGLALRVCCMSSSSASLLASSLTASSRCSVVAMERGGCSMLACQQTKRSMDPCQASTVMAATCREHL